MSTDDPTVPNVARGQREPEGKAGQPSRRRWTTVDVLAFVVVFACLVLLAGWLSMGAR